VAQSQFLLLVLPPLFSFYEMGRDAPFLLRHLDDFVAAVHLNGGVDSTGGIGIRLRSALIARNM